MLTFQTLENLIHNFIFVEQFKNFENQLFLVFLKHLKLKLHFAQLLKT